MSQKIQVIGILGTGQLAEFIITGINKINAPYNFILSPRSHARALKLKNSIYAEGAHIRPLARPHNGPDIVENILCLCPNHHVLFDGGGFGINDDFSLLGIDGKLYVHNNHPIDIQYLKYHRNFHEL